MRRENYWFRAVIFLIIHGYYSFLSADVLNIHLHYFLPFFYIYFSSNIFDILIFYQLYLLIVYSIDIVLKLIFNFLCFFCNFSIYFYIYFQTICIRNISLCNFMDADGDFYADTSRMQIFDTSLI